MAVARLSITFLRSFKGIFCCPANDEEFELLVVLLACWFCMFSELIFGLTRFILLVSLIALLNCSNDSLSLIRASSLNWALKNLSNSSKSLQEHNNYLIHN